MWLYVHVTRAKREEAEQAKTGFIRVCDSLAPVSAAADLTSSALPPVPPSVPDGQEKNRAYGLRSCALPPPPPPPPPYSYLYYGRLA
ncbi:hypothetical protein OPQ81_010068 [Rhizoctonia solani]|nr:hypothetical protein OPQ81_010068 [Rhizoctonia solani]